MAGRAISRAVPRTLIYSPPVAYTRAMAKPAKLLVAQTADNIDDLVDALSGYEIIKTTNLHQAERMLTETTIDLFVIGIHFDDSQALQLLQFIRDSDKHKKVPVVMVRYRASEVSEILRQTMSVMKTLRAISTYIEIDVDAELPFYERVRIAVETFLPPKKRAGLVDPIRA